MRHQMYVQTRPMQGPMNKRSHDENHENKDGNASENAGENVPDDICFMQDATHGGLKLRNRLLRIYDSMPMGTKQVSVTYLKELIKNVPKDVHGLVMNDVSPVDRQNFQSLEKCMRVRTRDALRKYIPDSEATEYFLQLCSKVTESLMLHDLTPHDRIEMMFHAVYFLRIWKKWMKDSCYNTLKDVNFITSNAYNCIELNAENLLKLIRKFRDQGKPELFLPTIFDSQACERAFRQFRSMGTPNFNKINFCLYELFHMVKRLEVQNDIMYTKLANVNVKFPKLEKSKKQTTIYPLPTEEEIEDCLSRAKRFAINDAEMFRMFIDYNSIDTCVISIPRCFYKNMQLDDESANDSEDESDIDFDTGDNTMDENEVISREIEDDNDLVEDENRAYVTVTDPVTGKKKIIRKSTYVWSISEGKSKISSDRLIRVQQAESSQPLAKHLAKPMNLPPNSKVYVSKLFSIGDWCFFKNDGMICIGQVLTFKFANGKSAKEKLYKGNFVNLANNEDENNSCNLNYNEASSSASKKANSNNS